LLLLPALLLVVPLGGPAAAAGAALTPARLPLLDKRCWRPAMPLLCWRCSFETVSKGGLGAATRLVQSKAVQGGSATG
jgi:hypothetical protein